MKHLLRLACAVVLNVVLVSSVAWAQASSLTGRLVDPQGAVIANAQVTLSAAGQPARSTRSAQDGTFAIQAIAAGTYTLRADAGGFAPFMQTVVVSASAVPVTITLQVAGVNEDATVQGALVGTAATGKTTVPARELPLTIDTVSRQLIDEQGDNDLVSALKNVPGVYAFTTYGVYEYYTFRGFLDSVQLLDGVRNEGNRVNTS